MPDLKGPDKFKTTGKAIELVGGELEFAKNYLSGFEFKTWLADRIPGYTVSSFASNVLRIKRDGAAKTSRLTPLLGCPSGCRGSPPDETSQLSQWCEIGRVDDRRRHPRELWSSA